MARTLLFVLSILVAGFASFYQFFLKDLLTITYGIGRVVGRIEDAPYTCRQVVHKQLEACEDLWIDERARVLYGACAGAESRSEWNQAIGNFNVKGRRPSGSELIALDIDNPGADGFFNLRAIKPVGYVGATGAGDESMDFVGFDVEEVDRETLHFFFVNQRPPVDSDKKYIDAMQTGANSTIEVFEFKRGEKTMKHLRTVYSPAVFTPNRVAALGDGAFVVSNDHSVKVGMRKEFDPIIGGGSIAYCSAGSECHIATNVTLKFPNGICRGADGLIYTPSSVDGTVKIFQLQGDKSLAHIKTILPGMPLDNISPDVHGNLWVPGFPDLQKSMKWMENPLVNTAPVSVFKIEKTKAGEYVIEKPLEDVHASVLSGITTVRHDVKTGRLFLGGAFNRYIGVCEPKKVEK